MDFQTFQPLCPYSYMSYVYPYDHTRMEATCQRKDRIPPGESWGICDKAHCPYFGEKITGDNIVIYDSLGNVVATAETMTATLILEPESYKDILGETGFKDGMMWPSPYPLIPEVENEEGSWKE